MVDFNDLEKERQKRLAQYKKRILIGVIVSLCGAGLAVGGFFLLSKTFILMLLGLLAIGVGIGIASSSSGIARKYSRDYKKPIVETLLKKYYDLVQYDERGGLPLAEIYNSGLITRRADRWHMEDLIQGEYHNIGFRTCDVHLEEMHQYTDKDGHTHTEWITFFRGRWYQFFLNRSFNTSIRIKEKKRIKEMVTKGLEKVEVESIDFTDKFMAYAADEHQFFYIFTPVVIEKMIELEKMHRGKFMFSLQGNIVNFGIDDNRDYLEIGLKQPLVEEKLEAYEMQIGIMAAIIKEFRFDTEKYNPTQHQDENIQEINVPIEDLVQQGIDKLKDKLENLDNILENKLNQIDNMSAEEAADEVSRIDEELDSYNDLTDKI